MNPRRLSLTIAGSGNPSCESYPPDLCVGRGIAHRVRFFGLADRPEKDEIYAEAGFLLAPERFGMVVAEALAHAVPAVVSREIP